MNAVCSFDLLKKGRNFVWSYECQKSFDCLKVKLGGPTLLVHSLFDRPSVIQYDASDKRIGFVLAQQHDDQLHPILFRGRLLIDIEQRLLQLTRNCWLAILLLNDVRSIF